jgi:hypothetical protein
MNASRPHAARWIAVALAGITVHGATTSTPILFFVSTGRGNGRDRGHNLKNFSQTISSVGRKTDNAASTGLP